MIEKSFKIVFVGNSKVGKTSFLIRYRNNTFADPNFVVYNGIFTDIKDGKILYRVYLADTAGGTDNIRLRSFQYFETGAFVLCFAINDTYSYNSIKQQWIPEIRPFIDNAPLILVGTKSDLRNENSIHVKRAKELQKECKAAFYIECSAKDGSGVNDVISATLSAYKNACKVRKKSKCTII